MKYQIKGLLIGVPKHCNLYYVISTVYKKQIPKWFANKYNEVNKETWSEQIEN